MSDRLARRARLAVRPNPDPGHDYLVEFAAPLAGARLVLRLVPDRLLATPEGLAAWLAALPAEPAPEALALAVLDDLNDVLVPRWVSVSLTGQGALRHRVVIEDRQPGWDNPALIARLRPL